MGECRMGTKEGRRRRPCPNRPPTRPAAVTSVTPSWIRRWGSLSLLALHSLLLKSSNAAHIRGATGPGQDVLWRNIAYVCA